MESNVLVLYIVISVHVTALLQSSYLIRPNFVWSLFHYQVLFIIMLALLQDVCSHSDSPTTVTDCWPKRVVEYSVDSLSSCWGSRGCCIFLFSRDRFKGNFLFSSPWQGKEATFFYRSHYIFTNVKLNYKMMDLSLLDRLTMQIITRLSVSKLIELKGIQTNAIISCLTFSSWVWHF